MSDSSNPPFADTLARDGLKLSDAELKRLSVRETSFTQKSGFAVMDSVIMMVDDEPLNIEMTKAFLEDAGYRRFVFTDKPEEAVELMRLEQPHVLLLDLSMPKVDGMEILAILRDDAYLRHVPVIILTNKADAPTKLKALELGAMDFLAKPVDPSELALRLRNTLAAAAQRRYLISHDALTKLPNRQTYLANVGLAIESAQLLGHHCALLHIGIDKLSHLNDALGRPAVDLLLQRMAKRLRYCVEGAQGGVLGSLESQYPGLYRFDGDEFAILIPYLDEIGASASLINSLLEAAATDLRIGGSEVSITASLGVAVYPMDGLVSDELAKNAGMAMRQARQTGNTYVFFTAELKEKAFRTLLVGADVRRALDKNEISVLYQPKIEVSTGRLVGVESVLRWTKADQTVAEGDDVFRHASTSDLAHGLAEWVFLQIRIHTALWQSAGLKVFPVGVKFSLRQFTPDQLVKMISVAIIRGVKAKMLCLELSGIAGSSDASGVGPMTTKLRNWGFRIALDGFGTGEVSLADLAHLSIDEIKMDPGFVSGIENKSHNAAIIRSTLGLARDLDCSLVVQGVQTAQQLAFLKEINADQCQGVLFSDPLSHTDFASKWLANAPHP